MRLDTRGLERLGSTLLDAFGRQHWWPARSPFEIAVGAVLVQRTAWRNAELAIAALDAQGLLEPAQLARVPAPALRKLVRPAGFAAAKAEYLLNLAAFVADSGGIAALRRQPTDRLRSSLLAVRGIGPETADSILLYLFGRPVWIVDAYAERIFSRISAETFDARRQRSLLHAWIDAARVADLQELHALLVELGKTHCRVKPVCSGCPLQTGCAFARRAQAASGDA